MGSDNGAEKAIQRIICLPVDRHGDQTNDSVLWLIRQKDFVMMVKRILGEQPGDGFSEAVCVLNRK